MFDIGFAELVLIFIVGLLVLGPERLPHAIKKVVQWIRTIRGMASSVQSELERELKLNELKENIKKAEALKLSDVSPELAESINELKSSAQAMQQQIDDTAQVMNQEITQTQKELNDRLNELSEAERAELAEAEQEELFIEDESDSSVKTVSKQNKEVE